MKIKKCALFDFDKTISDRDSLLGFLLFSEGKLGTLLKLLRVTPYVFAYVLKILPNKVIKKKLFQVFFSDWSVEEFQRHSREYSQRCIPKIIRDDALRRIFWHKKKGDRVIVVSATFKEYLQHWCKSYNLELIATEVHFDLASSSSTTPQDKSKDQSIGKSFTINNCYGPEKVSRIKEYLGEREVGENYFYAYGDSDGDREMLEFADEGYYRRFS
ncbi:MAG: HAD-IB family phosphatase [Oligoflexia bacterium]|nr:HAD-IB family phosphatase [Oligoflexia bacterium]